MYVSFRAYTRRRLWSDRNQIWHTHADYSPNGSGLNKNQPCVTQRGLGGFRGSKNQKSGITTKRMDQLAPNLAHMGGFIMGGNGRASASGYFALVNLTKECKISLVKYQMA